MVIRQIVIIFLLILANGIFAMAEAAVISARKARLQERANQGDRPARTALELANAPNRFLSTTQLGITLISILAGAFGGATLTDDLAAWLARYALPMGARHAVALAVVVGGITYVSLVIGELVPKRLALNHPEDIASRMAGPMRRLSAMTAPVVTLLGASTNVVLHLIGARRTAEPPVTEEEVKILIRQGAAAGVFLPVEQEMVQGVFRLGDRRVNELMTPRMRVDWLDLSLPLEDNLRKMETSRYSRFPIATGALDGLVGVVSMRAIWVAQRCGEPVDLRALAWRPPLFPEELPAFRALETLRSTGREMAAVISEYGGVQGILTLTDILEAVAGEGAERSDEGEPRTQHREDGSWLLDGLLPAVEVKEILGLRSLPGETRNEFETLGGFMLGRIQRLPERNDAFTWHGYRWEVAAMDGRRVAKVIVRPAEQP